MPAQSVEDEEEDEGEERVTSFCGGDADDATDAGGGLLGEIEAALGIGLTDGSIRINSVHRPFSFRKMKCDTSVSVRPLPFSL